MTNPHEFRRLNSVDLDVQELENRLELVTAPAAEWGSPCYTDPEAI